LLQVLNHRFDDKEEEGVGIAADKNLLDFGPRSDHEDKEDESDSDYLYELPSGQLKYNLLIEAGLNYFRTGCQRLRNLATLASSK